MDADTVLGPRYDEATEVTKRFMEKFEAEHFEPMLKKFVDTFQDRLWTEVTCFLINDTASNLQSEIYNGIESSVKALLSGERWALERYALADRYDVKAVRETVAKHIAPELQDRRLAELETENEDLKRTIRRLQQERY